MLTSLAALRAGSETEVLIVSNNIRVEVFELSEIDTIFTEGTDGNDVYDFKKIDGRIDHLNLTLGDGADVVISAGDVDNDGVDWMQSITILGEDGEDYINIDASLLGLAATVGNPLPYKLQGGLKDDRVKVTGVNTLYDGVLLQGGLGDDTIMGADGSERAIGGIDDNGDGSNTVFDGFDVLITNGGNDYLDGGDEYDKFDAPDSTADIALYSTKKGSGYAAGDQVRASNFYQADGTPFDHYDAMGRPIDNTPDPTTGLGTLVVLTDDNFTVRNFSGDIIDGGAGDDIIRGGHGFDEIMAGDGFNTIYGEQGNDIIDAGSGATVVDAGSGNDTISWLYEPIAPGAMLDMSGGEGDLDVLDLKIAESADGANVILLEHAAPGTTDTTARLTVDGNPLLLDLIENVRINARTGTDSINVTDLLDTNIQVVELQLGSDLAKMWSALRDTDGTHTVFPGNYGVSADNPDGTVASDPDLRESHYFYRFDLAANGVYLYEDDGAPQLFAVNQAANFDPSVANIDQHLQEVFLTDGLDRVNLFYGYDENVTESGRIPDTIVDNVLVPGNSVEIAAGMSAAEVESKLESLSQVGDVIVTGAGTLADPWKINLISANTDTSGKFKRFAHHYDVQSYIGTLAPRDDTRVDQRFYRINDPDAEYLYLDDGDPATADQPVLIEKATAANLIEANRIQLLHINTWELGSGQDAILWYGDEGIVIEQDDAANDIRGRLESRIADITEVIVTGSATEDEPWSFEFTNTAQLAGGINNLQLELTAGGGNLDPSTTVIRTTIGTTIPAADVNDHQLIGLPSNAAEVEFRYLDLAVVLLGSDIDNDEDIQAGKLQIFLRTIANLGSVTVAHDGSDFIVTFPSAEAEDILFDAGKGIMALKRGSGGTDDATRVLSASIVREGTEFYFGRNTATITLARDTGTFEILAADLETALETQLDGVNDISIVAGTNPADAWTFAFNDANRNGSDAYHLLEFAVTRQYESRISHANLIQHIDLNGATNGIVSYGDATIPVDDEMSATELENAFNILTVLTDHSVSVTGANGVFEVIFAPDDADVTGIEYEILSLTIGGELQAASTVGNSVQRIVLDDMLDINGMDSEGLAKQAIIGYGSREYVIDSTMNAAAIEAELVKLYDSLPLATGSMVMVRELSNSTLAVTGDHGDWTVTLTPTDGSSNDFKRFTFRVIENVNSPQHSSASIAEPGKRVQRFDATAADNSKPVTAWYGNSGVDINGAFTQADLKAALESIKGVTRVDVLNTVTAGVWDIRIVIADVTSNGDFFDVRVERFEQGATVIQTTPRDAVNNLSFSRSMRSAELATQSIFLAGWQDHAAIRYGSQSVEITRGMSGAEITAALESMGNINDVWVSGTGSSIIQDTLTQQTVPTAAVIEGTQFRYNGSIVTLGAGDIDADGNTQAGLLQTLLRTLDPTLSNLTVGFSSATDPYSIDLGTSTVQQLFYDDGNADIGATVTNTLQRQAIEAGSIAVGTQFRFAGSLVTLSAADISNNPQTQAGLLQTVLDPLVDPANPDVVTVRHRIEDNYFEIDFVNTVTSVLRFNDGRNAVAADPGLETVETPWNIVLRDLETDQFGNPFVFERVVKVQDMVRALTVSIAQTSQTQLIPEAAIVDGTQFSDGDNMITLVASDLDADTGIQAGLLEDKFRATAVPGSLFYNNGAGNVSANTGADSRQQIIPKVNVTAAMTFSYAGNSSAPLISSGSLNTDPEIIAETIQNRLRVVSGLRDVVVSYDDLGSNYRVDFVSIPGLVNINVSYNAGFYEVNFAAVQQLSYNTGAGAVNAAANPTIGLDLQSIDESAIVDGTVITYNGTNITLGVADIDNIDTANQAQLLKIRLADEPLLADVTVFHDATASTYVVAFPGPIDVLYNTGGPFAEVAIPADIVVGSLELPANIETATFSTATQSVTIDVTPPPSEGDIRTQLLNQIDSLGTGATIAVQGAGTPAEPWVIRLNNYNETNPVTVSYDFGSFGDPTPDFDVVPSTAVAGTDILAGTQFFFDGAGLILTAADINAADSDAQAALLQIRLATLTGLNSLQVIADGTDFLFIYDSADEQALTVVSAADFMALLSGTSLNDQVVPASALVADSAFAYDGSIITLGAADIDENDITNQSQLLQDRLRLLSGLENVSVSFAAGGFNVNFANALPLLNGAPGSTVPARVINNNANIQALAAADIIDGLEIGYDGASLSLSAIDIDASTIIQASNLQSRLRTLPGLEHVTVAYEAVNDEYIVEFVQVLNFVSANDSVNSISADFHVAQIDLPTAVEVARFFYEGKSATIVLPENSLSLAGVTVSTRADIQAKLDSLGTGATVIIDDSDPDNKNWQISIEGFDPDNPVVATYDYGQFMALSSNTLETRQVIEKLDSENEFQPLTTILDSNLILASFSATANLASSSVYISSAQTIERLGPRLVEKPTWADLDGDGTVELTGKTDFFADPVYVTDHSIDTVNIGGGAADERDYFLVGHEVFDTGEIDEDGNPITETQIDTVQVTHRRLNSDGTLDDSDRVIITVRGIDLDDLVNSVEHDIITIDGRAGDDRIVAGFLPKDPDDPDLAVTLQDIISARAADNLVFIGGADNDRIVGTAREDIIDSGSGDDSVTGGAGKDTFIDISGTDTLLEVRDLNFSLTDSSLTISGLEQNLLDFTQFDPINEIEGIPEGFDNFEIFELFGGASNNNFAVTGFTQTAFLDGTELSDTYVVTLQGRPGRPTADPVEGIHRRHRNW